MAGASNIQWCEPCGREGENQQAHSWCSDCSEPLCGECLKFHRKGKTTANHKTIPILQAEKLGSSVLNIPDICHIHDDQKLSLFCVQHDTICCAFCLRESHNTCKDVKSIEKASKGVKMGTAIDDVQHRISECSFMISKILDEYKNNLSSLSDQKDEYKGKITNFRKELNLFLDTLEQEIDTKFDAFDMECTSEIEKKIKDLTTIKKKSESRQTDIETLKEHASETKLFAAIKTIDLLQCEEEQFLSKFQEGLVAYKLRFPLVNFIEKIKPILATLSEIQIERIKTTVQNPKKVQQVRVYKMQQGNPSFLQKISCSTLRMTSFHAACFTTDNRIVFTGTPICVYDMSSSGVETIPSRLMAIDITCDSKNNIYGAFGPISINKIDIENMELEASCEINIKRKQNDSRYTCIGANDDILYSNYNDKIILFNPRGTIVKSLETRLKPSFMCVDYSGGIFISDRISIIYITESGSHNQIPVKMKTGDDITGLGIDKQGQLYACISNNMKGSVVRINTTTGYEEPILENLVFPRDITFHPTKNMFLIITDKGDECSVYEVTK